MMKICHKVLKIGIALGPVLSFRQITFKYFVQSNSMVRSLIKRWLSNRDYIVKSTVNCILTNM
jgi:hypothetical protein